jgi:D-serine deaminase-like pyridoxal phosphate-dependent protein
MKKITQGGLGPNARFKGVPGGRSQLSTPALLLDIDALDRNVRRMADFAKSTGVNIRPHSKGNKSIAISKRQLAAGAIGICCTTIGEAEVMGSAGPPSILITSPVVTPTMIGRLLALNETVEDLVVVMDDAGNADAVAAAIGNSGKPIGVLVEYDVGQGRTGVVGEDKAVALVRKISSMPELSYRGLQAYYGHLQHVPAFAERRREAEAQIVRIRSLVAVLERENLTPQIVSGGGTGTFEIDAASGVFTELQVGSYPFMDREYVEIESGHNPNAKFEPALFVQATVLNAGRPGFAVVNAGYKSFATEGGPPVVWSPKLSGTGYRLMGDEHGGVTYDAASGHLELGDAVEFLTPHCDPTINLYDFYHCVRGDTLVDIWPVDARGR